MTLDPGHFLYSKDEPMFKTFLNPNLKQKLINQGLPTRLVAI